MDNELHIPDTDETNERTAQVKHDMTRIIGRLSQQLQDFEEGLISLEEIEHTRDTLKNLINR